MVINQYSIVIVNLDQTIGSEIKKTRPCVVISPNELNRHLRTVVIAPMTSSQKNYPSRVPVVHNDKHGSIALDQIRTIDRARIISVVGELSRTELAQCKAVIKETFVD